MTYITAIKPFSSTTQIWDLGWATYKATGDMRLLTRMRRIGIRFQYY